ncbi:type VI secretion system tip protein TssI/VgrG [Caballeronia sp. LZ062]|uniref:type VI secretion system Vgr family protein n=1 Tax=unclassified Caballeronia TaxID=2646786 RepID=UPI00285F5DF8|nr:MULTISPECIES: type VI secretion system tip protein TssI/VgrG [unclassified Caballeronia]MDR5854833.1 type VI secretion system tip protein TssI/VgrG [Caballeronia sp. LZ050]MDR5870638.1 type VI secretion system tip protein TssI/VgrG [Caballeronia sp. LZ062]
MFNPLQSRTLKVQCEALPTWGKDDILLPQRVKGTETLGELFEYRVDFATLDSPTFRLYKARELIKPDDYIGKIVKIRIEFEGKGTFVPGLPGNQGAGNVGAGVRTIEGIITAVEQIGSDERRAYYQFTVRPWLWLLSQNKDNRIFRNVTVLEATEAVLTGTKYKFPWKTRLAGFLLNNNIFPKRDYIRQFWQSDYDFLIQLWSEWGIYYHFDGMTLMLCDSPGSHKDHKNAYDTILFHAPEDKRIDEEHIHSLRVSRQITAGDVTLNDYDYTRSNGTFLVNRSDHSNSSFDNIEQYHWGDYTQPLAGAMGLDGQPNDFRNEGEYLAWVRVGSMRCEGLRAYGTANARGMMTGRRFRLKSHPQPEVNREYLVVSTSIDVRNPDELTATSGSDAHYHCKTDFVVQPANAFFKLKPKDKPRAYPETAVVTGPDKQPIWLDAYGRIRCQFKWDRLGENDQNSSCWLRVSLPWHGGPHSFVSVPRVGDEITVGYHEGDPDKPFVMSSKVNEFNPPPFKLPKNMALTGLVSHAFEGQGHNVVVTDDTPGKQQVQVASDQANSRLVLGYNTRIAYGDGRQQARGLGWELATDAWGVLRANQGMLVTTETREAASAPARDIGETVARLTQARDIHESMAELAQQHGAQDASGNQSDVAKSIKAANDELRGTGTANMDRGEFPEFAAPHLTLASPAGIQSTTAGSTHIASEQDFAVTAGGSVSFAAARSLFASVMNGVALFVRKAGMMLVAASGKIRIEAQEDGLDVIAKKDVHIASEDGWINLTAVKGIRFNGAGTTLELSAAGLLGATNGRFLVHAADHQTDGPQSTPPMFPPRSYTDTSSLSHLYHDDEPVQGAKFEIHYDDGKRYSGTLDGAGHADLSGAPVGVGRIKVGPDSRPLQVKANDANPGYKPRWGEGDFDASAKKQNNGGVWLKGGETQYFIDFSHPYNKVLEDYVKK